MWDSGSGAVCVRRDMWDGDSGAVCVLGGTCGKVV